MKIVKLYDVGDVVVVEPYSIFSNPTPIGWNTLPNGYGTSYYEDDEFIFQKSLTLYAQYTHVSVEYHIISALDDNTYIEYNPGYVIKFGSRVQVADFGIKNFRVWYDNNGNQLSAGQFITLTGNIDFYMSADCTYELSYDANGGKGTMHPSYSTEHLYFDNGVSVVQNANITLPECSFTKENYICEQWNIYNSFQPIGKTISLSSNAIAYAKWDALTEHTLALGVLEVRHELMYRYLMIKISSTYSNRKRTSLTKLSFVDEFGNAFQVPSNAVAYGINASPISQYDGFMHMFNDSAGFNIEKFPCFIIVDLQSQCFDAAKYVNWQMATPLYGFINDFPNMFQLYFSNDNEVWYFADECNYVNTPIANNQTIANGLLVVSEQYFHLNDIDND